MPKKEKIENQPKYDINRILGWHYGASDTLQEVVVLFNRTEEAVKDKYRICDVDIEKDTVNGSWEFIYKVVEK